jgi:hypothetical protein
MPDAPPVEPKRSLFEKLGAGLPVGLTALATILAGLSTGELNRAMLWRSTAAQDQGKANDQWSLAAHKRDRALMCETTADALRAVGGYRTPPDLPKTPTPEFVQQAGAYISGSGEPPATDAGVRGVLWAMQMGYDGDATVLARGVDGATLNAEIRAGLAKVGEVERAFDAELSAAKERATAAPAEGKAAATALRYEVDSRRYRAEATANQWVGFLYEVRIKRSTAESESHLHRSENFFFAMLAAQVGGVGSSLALARKRRSVLWLVAGIAGLVAVGFGAFVYLTM